MADIKCPQCGRMIPEGNMVQHLMDEHQMTKEDAQAWIDQNAGGGGE